MVVVVMVLTTVCRVDGRSCRYACLGRAAIFRRESGLAVDAAAPEGPEAGARDIARICYLHAEGSLCERRFVVPNLSCDLPPYCVLEAQMPLRSGLNAPERVNRPGQGDLGSQLDVTMTA